MKISKAWSASTVRSHGKSVNFYFVDLGTLEISPMRLSKTTKGMGDQLSGE